jgi:Bacterial toxin 50
VWPLPEIASPEANSEITSELTGEVIPEVEVEVGGAAEAGGTAIPEGNFGKQGKHIPGDNNFIPGRSELTADPAELVKSAGSGVPVNSVVPGSPGFKERIDFGRSTHCSGTPMNNDFTNHAYLRLSVQRGLLGNVTSNLAGIYTNSGDKTIVISAYFFDAPSDEDIASVEDAAGEVIADYPDDYSVTTHYGLMSEIRFNQFEWNFLRAEACK